MKMIWIVENDIVTAKFPNEEEAREFQKTLPPGSSKWSEVI